MSGRPDSFMPLYIGDYLADTAHLTAAEHGAYLLLLMHYWRTGKPIAAEDAMLSRITRLSLEEWMAVKVTVTAFFTVTVMDTVTVLTHKRVEEEITHARGKYEIRKAASDRANAAKKAASERMRNRDGDRSGDRDGVPIGTQPQPQPQSSNEDSPSLRSGHRKRAAPPFQRPDWVPEKAWNDFVEYRKSSKHGKLNARGLELAVSKLEKLRADGEDVTAVLEQSVFRGWGGLFAVKADSQGPPNGRAPAKIISISNEKPPDEPCH